MEGPHALIKVAEAVAGAFAWVVSVIGGIVLALAYFAKNSYEQVIAAKDTRIAHLEGRMSKTLIDYERHQREGLEKAVKTLQDAREKAEANRLAWQRKYQDREKRLFALHENLQQ